MYALVDCNNFYCSCESNFAPHLNDKPLVVLSNNDGCIISRSRAAKALNIPMGAPYYQWKKFFEMHGVTIFSSNYELYGDMSQRVMVILKDAYPNMEIYSIDEAFLQLPTNTSLDALVQLRDSIFQQTGIPTSIGVGSTKTLAKLANQLAKQQQEKVVWITEQNQETYLRTFPIEKIWGIGRRLAERLQHLNIYTAWQLRTTDSKLLRLQFNVTLEKTVQELQGKPCLGLEIPKDKKQIIASRSFGKLVTRLEELEEAVSTYSTRAAVKLRKQHSVASAIYVYIQTNTFRQNHPQYGNGVTYTFPAPTADTRCFIRAAKLCLRRIYKKEYQYHKAGIMLLDIAPEGQRQYDLFMPVIDPKSERVMALLDAVNTTLGKNTLSFAASGIKKPWAIQSNHRSPRYTTRWKELVRVQCK